jgi:hypothetical protein
MHLGHDHPPILSFTEASRIVAAKKGGAEEVQLWKGGGTLNAPSRAPLFLQELVAVFD